MAKKSNLKKEKLMLTLYLFFVSLCFILVLWYYNASNKVYTLEVKGDTNIIIERGSTYNDPGAILYDNNRKDYSKKIKVKSEVDTSKTGVYEVNYYFKDIFVRRIVQVVNKIEEDEDIDIPGNNYIDKEDNGKDDNNDKIDEDDEKFKMSKIYLLGKEEVYVEAFKPYKEEGFSAIDYIDGNITKNVKVTHNIDNTKAGKYEIKYTVTNSRGEVISKSRYINIVLVDFNLKLNTTNYTNKNVDINIDIVDKDMEYLILPDGKTIKEKKYTYSVSKNGEYKFVLYNKHGFVKEKIIKVTNINKSNPNVSCSAKFSNGQTTVTINASDDIGIRNYVVNNKNYNTNVIVVNGLVSKNDVVVYDYAGNSNKTSCEIKTSVLVESIKADGVIVNVKARSINSSIKGYYFNYTNKVPSKNQGYIATSSNTIDVVRLAGTTYVWVEDSNGGISEAATVNVSNGAIRNSGSILKSNSLGNYMKSKGGSIDDFNKLMARSVRAAGLYTKTGAATAGVALVTGLSQKYGITIPYWRGGKTSTIGAYHSWGIYRKNPTYEGYNYYGMDCDGFVNWSYLNAGIVYKSILANSYYHWSGLPVSKQNGEIGDVMRTTGHVKLIVGKTDNAFIIAEEAGKNYGLIISTHSFNDTNGYIIIKGEELIKNYEHMGNSSYPSGF